MNQTYHLLLPFLVIGLISGCAQNESGGGQVDYEETKKMVVDILHTDDGRKAIEEVMTSDGMKQNLVMEQATVSDTIQTTLTSDKGTQFLQKSFDDPKFAESMAKSMQKENEKLLKNLMKDPEYRAMMVEILKDPAIQSDVTDILKSNDYRTHLQTVVAETFESPLYQARIQDILLKAANKPQGGKQAQGGGGGGDQGSSGNQSGGGGGGA
ncbi:spore gernimation protein GerD [Bacillus canaveralius]|uniref:Spore gernimation protein GerD n=1 Tax=Bacillus canaveralius TaxID=1403243 RepID=A0A2N5GPQ7_9BACI|nr:spore germination lipoprotein GerD [Bacillus canaveralius]PLR84727.1 spore gernimation protein GerD [Bacillus canaveralius]PLS00445.1 spore gernimation protein GerD [Bacillus canaveralius]RSK52266.1 spore gernimation protein GerD [Bacillus canaveralius]